MTHKTQWAVNLIESERGWGSRVDDTVIFDDYDEAVQYVKNFNAKNTASSAPDWYMFAENPHPVPQKP